jgi:hypothetical protein
MGTNLLEYGPALVIAIGKGFVASILDVGDGFLIVPEFTLFFTSIRRPPSARTSP